MAELGTRTIRVKLDTSVALPSNLDIASWRGNALDLEVGIFDTSSTVASITNVTSVNVKVQASQTDNTTLMDSTVAFASMDAALTAATWTDGTAQHATFEFTNAQANLTITDSSCKYWIVFSALLSSGDTVTLAAGDFTLWEDNDTTAGDPDVNPGTAITLEEADARYAALGDSGAGWELKTADFTAEPNGKYLIGDKDITVTPSFSNDGEFIEFYMHDPTSPDVGTRTVFTYDGSTITVKQYKDATAYATAEQGTLAASAVQPASTPSLAGVNIDTPTSTTAVLNVGNYNTTNSNIRTGSLEFQPYSIGNAWIGENIYFNGSSFKRRSTGTGGLFYFLGTEGQFRFAPSGAAGSSVTPNCNWKINYDGSMAVGPSLSSGAANYTGYKFKIDPSGNVHALGTVIAGSYTVATLPTPTAGMRAHVTDATATTFYSTVAGGGANTVPVFYNGTNWVIA